MAQNATEMLHEIKCLKNKVAALESTIAGPVLTEEEQKKADYTAILVGRLGPLVEAGVRCQDRIKQNQVDQNRIAVLQKSRTPLWVAKNTDPEAAKKLIAIDEEIASIRKLTREFPVQIHQLTELETRAKRAFCGI